MPAVVDREGDKSKIERLFEERASALKAFFHRKVIRRGDVEDLTQEVYLRMLRVKDPDAIRNPEAYLFTVAANLAKEYAVAQRRSLEFLEAAQADFTAPVANLHATEQEVDTDLRLRRLEKALLELSPKCQAAVVMQLKHGLTYAEIGQRLGVSANMVKKYLSRGLAHCRRRLKRME